MGDAEKLLGGQRLEAAEIEPLLRPDKALFDQTLCIARVVVLMCRRHHPPQHRVAGNQDPGAVELFEQQCVLGVSAAFLRQLFGGPVAKRFGMHQEEMRMQADLGGAVFQQSGLVP